MNQQPAAIDPLVRYEITVYITRPVRYDVDVPMSEQEEYAVSRDAKRTVEREVLKWMRRLDKDVDGELMSAEIIQGVVR